MKKKDRKRGSTPSYIYKSSSSTFQIQTMTMAGSHKPGSIRVGYRKVVGLRTHHDIKARAGNKERGKARHGARARVPERGGNQDKG